MLNVTVMSFGKESVGDSFIEVGEEDLPMLSKYILGIDFFASGARDVHYTKVLWTMVIFIEFYISKQENKFECV